MAPVLALLTKSIGPILAQGVIGKLLKTNGADSKMQRVLEATEKGVSIIAALRGEFGDDFLKALSGSTGDNNAQGFTYEAGCADYIKLNTETVGDARLATLREELNINLDRLTVMRKVADEVLLNYFRGTISCWKKRYIESFGYDDDARKVFAKMNDLLDGNNRKFKGVIENITRICFGGVGLYMMFYGVLLIINEKVGLWQQIKTKVAGFPMFEVGFLMITGAIFVALSRYKLSNKNAISTCIKMAYDLLEKRHMNAV